MGAATSTCTLEACGCGGGGGGTGEEGTGGSTTARCFFGGRTEASFD